MTNQTLYLVHTVLELGVSSRESSDLGLHHVQSVTTTSQLSQEVVSEI